jgi:hypothetical protein
MRLPKSFNDITIGQFQECYFILKNLRELDAGPKDLVSEVEYRLEFLKAWCRVISILSGIEYSVVEQMPQDRIMVLKKRLEFILDDEKINNKVKQLIYLKGSVYKPCIEANKLSPAQGIDIKEFMRPQDKMTQKDMVVENCHKLLASMCLKYDWRKLAFKYDHKNHAQIAEDFKTVKMGEVYGMLFFCSRVYQKLTEATLTYISENHPQIKELAEHLEQVKSWASEKGLTPFGAGE